MNSNDMPTPLPDIANIAADGTGAVTKLLTEYTRAIELITLKNAAIEDLNHRLAAVNEYANNVDTKLKLLLTSKGLLDFDIEELSDEEQTDAGVTCNEEPENTRHEGGFLRPYGDNDATADTSRCQDGNLFGANEE
jgi:hypothetical protein